MSLAGMVSQAQVEEFIMFMAAVGVTAPGNPAPDMLNMSRTMADANGNVIPRQMGLHLRINNMKWTEPLIHAGLAFAIFHLLRQFRFGKKAVDAYKSGVAMVPGVGADGRVSAPSSNDVSAERERLKAKVLQAQRQVAAQRKVAVQNHGLAGTKPIGSSSRLR